MALFNSGELREQGWQIIKARGMASEAILKESFSEYKSTTTYDIFLSHSYKDKTVILGLVEFIKQLGYTVYIDWIVDTQLDRTAVTKDTARFLQARMTSCTCLFFAVSGNSSSSVWMPWELGYFDGIKGKVAILPILDNTTDTNTYYGQEYLGLYPFVVKDINMANKMRLWIRENPGKFVVFDDWLTGSLPVAR